MKLIVGLGNPGPKYQGVRHNLGFDVLDHLAKELAAQEWAHSQNLKGFYCKKVINGEEIELIKPTTYMNKSGLIFNQVMNLHSHELKPEDIVVIHDELDLPLGKIKVRLGGAAAGHHGVESIIGALGTDKFIRVRLGIGNLRTKSAEHKGQTLSAEKFVLEPFMHQEKSQVKHMVKQAIKALKILLEKGLEQAQNQFN